MRNCGTPVLQRLSSLPWVRIGVGHFFSCLLFFFLIFGKGLGERDGGKLLRLVLYNRGLRATCNDCDERWTEKKLCPEVYVLMSLQPRNTTTEFVQMYTCVRFVLFLGIECGHGLFQAKGVGALANHKQRRVIKQAA